MLLHLLSFALLNRAWIAAAPTQPMSAVPDGTSEEMIGWVSPDARRNTWGIIWSCLTIFIVCSWKCVHLNVPRHNESIAKWHKIKLCSRSEIPYWPEQPLLWKWTRKLLWMAFIAVAPEFGVAMALAQYLQARYDMKKANTATNRWGGIIVCDITPSSAAKENKVAGIPRQFVSKVEILTSLSQLNEPRLVPRITEEDISDLAISQLELTTLAFIPCALAMYTLWWQKPFGIERRHVLLRLPEEMMNLPADFTFSIDDLVRTEPGDKLLNMRRKDSGWDMFIDLVTALLDDSSGPTGEVSTENYMAERKDTTEGTSTGLPECTSPTSPIATLPDGTANPTGRPTSAEAVNRSGEQTTNANALTKASSRKVILQFVPSIVLYFTAVVFSAIHLAAWNWNFPSHLVRELWRWFALAALLTSLSPPVLVGIGTLIEKRYPDTGRLWIYDVLQHVVVWSVFAMLFFYTVSRFVILGLTLYSLSSMPERAYEKVSWMA